MNIAHVVPGLFGNYRGGSARLAQEVARAQREHGADAWVVGPGEVTTEFEATVGPVEAPVLVRAARTYKLLKERSAHLDIVASHFPLYGVPAILGTLREDIPVVTHFHGPWSGEASFEQRKPLSDVLKKWVESWTYSRCVHVIADSAVFASMFKRASGLDIPVSVVRPGVDPSQFHPAACTRRTRPTATDPVRLVAARRLVKRTGVDVLLRALAGLPARYVVEVVGSGPESKRLESLAVSLGVKERVSFRGEVAEDELVRSYQKADIAVVPSVSLEGFGLITLEALACGTPVVATDVGGLREALSGWTDVFAIPGDAKSLGTCIEHVAEDLPSPQDCQQFGSRWTWSNTALATIGIYSEYC